MKWFSRIEVLHISKKQQVKEEPADSLHKSVIDFLVFFANWVLSNEILMRYQRWKWVVYTVSYLLQKEGLNWS